MILLQLTGLVTSFYLTLSQRVSDNAFLEQISRYGFLAQFSSLLSCNGTLRHVYKLNNLHKNSQLCTQNLLFLGDEQGMLEDMTVVVQELKSVSFQVWKKCIWTGQKKVCKKSFMI